MKESRPSITARSVALARLRLSGPRTPDGDVVGRWIALEDRWASPAAVEAGGHLPADACPSAKASRQVGCLAERGQSGHDPGVLADQPVQPCAADDHTTCNVG